MTYIAFTGGCACGAVRYEVTARPTVTYQCYCRQCQYVSGGGPALFVMVPREEFHVVHGAAKGHEQKTSSGKEASRSFCPECGTPVFSEPKSANGTIAVKLGSIDQPERVPELRATFWTADAPPWAKIDPNLKRFETQ